MDRPEVPRLTDTADAVAFGAPPEELDLLVVDGFSSFVYRVPRHGSLVAGRAADADLKLTDGSVSKSHARLRAAKGILTIEDLRSHNGTAVNGERLASMRALRPGDVVTLGDVTLVVFAGQRATSRAAVVDVSELRRRLEQEIERSLRYARPLAIAVLEMGNGRPAPGSVESALAATLRVMDVAAWNGPRLVALLPELGGGEAEETVRRLVAALSAGAPEAKGGLAFCPSDGCDADTLLAAARAAAAGAVTGALAVASGSVTAHDLGERFLLVADAAMVRLVELAKRLAAADISVLVTGETGTGKENVALALHRWSPRGTRPFVTLNCAALPEALLESELFGYEKGAFSGASSPKPGLLERADGGTVLLDEIGELAPAAQAKLLRVLETKRVTRLGDVKEREIDLRLVAATNRDLPQEVKAGRFREDLYFRLAAATLALPPLRQRPRELPLLAQRFLAEACARAGREPIRISAPAMRCLVTYGWPGNVRELKNAMELAAATIADDVLEPWHLPERIAGAVTSPAGPPPPASTDPPSAGAERTHAFRPVYEEVRELEKRRIAEALEATGGVRTRAAELIGMPRRTFLMKLKEYGIGSPET